MQAVGQMDVGLHAFLYAEIDGVSVQLRDPAAPLLRKASAITYEPRPCLATLERRKISCPCRKSKPDFSVIVS